MAQETTLDRDTLVVRTGDEAEVDDNFDRVSFEPAYKRALAACERRRLYEQVMAPLWEDLKDNPTSVSAAEKLREQIMRDVDAFRRHDTPRSGGSSWSFDLPPGTSSFTPPYDYARTGPSEAGDLQLLPDPIAGSVYVEVHGGEHDDGLIGGSAAVGVGIEFRVGGLAKVRPFIEYDTSIGAYGWLLSASIESHLGFLVTADDGTIVSNSEDYKVGHVDSDGAYSELGILRPPYQEVKFLAEAHRRYRVWCWATLIGDQSGGSGHFGDSFAGGKIVTHVKLVTVEIH